MDEKDWLILRTIHEEGSITKASEALFMSQPALTKRIQLLEHDFKVKILSRSRKGITFTSEGEYLVKYSSQMLSRLNETKDHLVNMKSNSLQGTLKIGVSINYAYNILPGVLKQFSKHFPKIKTKITSGYSNEMIDLFKQKKFHIAIARGDFIWEGPRHHIDSDYICIVSKEKIKFELLPELPRLIYKTDTSLTRILDDWWKDHFDHPPFIASEVDNSQTCFEMVTQGLGFAIMPRFCIKTFKDLYVENIYWKNGDLLMRDTWMIYREEDLDLSAVREFISFMDDNNQSFISKKIY
ncbi:LysR family transcriptional regulator [Robertmurraya yapensis]|uniref:LysR family transcriptional regulator n=1 Tax=Bacillus yapensis TaxID=2492960 RepID=A0A431WI05_9BACI|nr:LysR family transcriptional regulator [Bacillus yapensis]RTR35166.1 LysR family transcriptional regulator [Bacillus yapensis]TKS97675.1 LysR family transcriptional regulator [Bacillus yapensis]